MYGCKHKMHLADPELTSNDIVVKIETVLRNTEANEKLEGPDKIVSLSTHLEEYMKNHNKIAKQPKLSKLYLNSQNNTYKKKGKTKFKDLEIGQLMNANHDKNDGTNNALKSKTKFVRKNVKHNGSILITDNDKRNDSAQKLVTGAVSSTTESRDKRMNVEIGLLGNIKKKIVAKPTDKANEKQSKSKMDESAGGDTQQSAATKPSSTSATKIQKKELMSSPPQSSFSTVH